MIWENNIDKQILFVIVEIVIILILFKMKLAWSYFRKHNYKTLTNQWYMLKNFYKFVVIVDFIKIDNMSMSAENDQDIPSIVHDKARKEYRLTLPNLANQDKVRFIAVS